MSRFLKYLNFSESEIESLPTPIKDGGRLIDGMQMIYEDMPKGRIRDEFAIAIAESSRLLISEINDFKGVKDVNDGEAPKPTTIGLKSDTTPKEEEPPTREEPPKREETPKEQEEREDKDPDEFKTLLDEIHNLQF